MVIFLVFFKLDWKSIVCNSCCSPLHKHIVSLDVHMDDMILMHILNSSADLHKIVPNFPFFINFPLFIAFAYLFRECFVHFLHDNAQVIVLCNAYSGALHNEPRIYHKINENLSSYHFKFVFFIKNSRSFFISFFLFFILFALRVLTFF